VELISSWIEQVAVILQESAARNRRAADSCRITATCSIQELMSSTKRRKGAPIYGSDGDTAAKTSILASLLPISILQQVSVCNDTIQTSRDIERAPHATDATAMSKRKRSAIWSYFDNEGGETEPTCTLCGETVASVQHCVKFCHWLGVVSYIYSIPPTSGIVSIRHRYFRYQHQNTRYRIGLVVSPITTIYFDRLCSHDVTV